MSNKLHNQSPRSDVLTHVSQNLRRCRLAAGMSQAALAEASGISRRMIVAVESGETNVSLVSLDRLAETLNTSFVELVAGPASEPERVEAVVWRGSHPQSQAVLLGSAPARRVAELWSWTLAVGETYSSEPDPSGWSEMIFVTEGELLLKLESSEATIKESGHYIFNSNQNYSYSNAGTKTARFIRNVVA